MAEVKDKVITVEAAKSIYDAVNENISSHTGNKSNPHGVTALQIGAVPTSRTINGKALSGNITLSASDVGAATSGHTHVVDSTLSDSSENPVQNKVVNEAVSQLSNEKDTQI